MSDAIDLSVKDIGQRLNNSIKYVCWRWGKSTNLLGKGEIMSSEIKLNLVACLCIFVAIIFVIMLVLFDKKN